MLQRITHMSTICLFSLDMYPASSLAQVNDAFPRAFMAPRTAAWQPKTPFDLSHYGSKVFTALLSAAPPPKAAYQKAFDAFRASTPEARTLGASVCLWIYCVHVENIYVVC